MDRDETIINYMPYVATVTRRLKWDRVAGLDDCVGVAFEALVIAVDSYDNTRGASLKTYIGIRVRSAVKDYLRKEAGGRSSQQGKPVNPGLAWLRWNLVYPLNIDDYKNTLAVSRNGTEQRVIEKDLFQQTLAFVESISIPSLVPRKTNPPKAFKSYFVDDLTMKEIAELQGVSDTRVQQIIFGITTKVKEHFKNRWTIPATHRLSLLECGMWNYEPEPGKPDNG